jgi:hypothetical protein
MTEEQQEAAPERQEQSEEGATTPEPFDQNPPVDPSQPQVGNSRAQFFMPQEENEGADEDAAEEEDEAGEGDA